MEKTPRLKDSFDVAIVGAGPAGSATAIRLAKAGLSVLLVEQKKFPRQKLCGEFISPECLGHFGDLGVIEGIKLAGGVDIQETVFFASNGKGISVKSEWFGQADSCALGLSRSEMDELLLRRARELGVDVREETAAAGLVFDDAKVTGIRLKEKAGLDTTVTAGITIDATGRTQALARRVEKPTAQRKRAVHVAFKAHVKGASISPSTCEIYAYRGGYGGCNSIENGLFNLCFIASAKDTRIFESDAERVMREVVFTNKRAGETLKHASIASEWLAVPIERFGRGRLVPAPGLLTVGDAAAFIDPFTGSGILLALESAKIAAGAITNCFKRQSDFETLASDYRRNYAAVFDSRLRVCSMLRHAAFIPLLADATISILNLSGGLRRRVAKATRL
ncbi:MAG: NAD(P)/FAD-dependent oxidoreductase [Pyrinomonadaceae bacterium]